MPRTEIFYQGLADLDVLIEDTSASSPDYFRVSKMPTEMGAGINTFRFTGNASLFAEDTPIYIEILDYNGDPIYYETDVDLESNEKNAIVSVYITEDIPPGDALIVICSIAQKDIDGNKLDTSSINLRWTFPVYIDPSKRNNAEIIFDELPTIFIVPGTGSYTNLGYPGGSRFTSSSINNLIYYNYNDTPVIVTASNASVGFNTNAVNGIISFNTSSLFGSNPDIFGSITSPSFTSSFSIINAGAIALDTTIESAVFNNVATYEPILVEISSANIQYELSASLSPSITQNSYNIATVYFNNLIPQTGTVSKIRSYYKSAGVGEYKFVNETDIDDLSPEFGFNVDAVTASLALPTIHRNDRFDLKFEFINPEGYIAKQVLESKNNLFIGGNTYIGGDDNLITGSLFVAGATDTGVQITGKNNASMLRSIGYSGFNNGISVGGTAGFVLYSGSVQPLLGAAESYSGVGLELVANSSSYFKYTTSGSGLLDIRTNKFFIGSTTTFLSGSDGKLEILNRTGTSPSTYSTKFHLQTNGNVTASAFIAQTGSYDTSSYQMLNTAVGLVDGKNIGRTLFHVHPQTLYTSSSTSVLQASSGSAGDTVAEVLNSGSFAVPYVSWSLAVNQPVYLLPFESAITVFSSAIARKDTENSSDCNLAMLVRITAWLPQTGSSVFETFGNPVTGSVDTLLGGVSGSISFGSTTLGTNSIIRSINNEGEINASQTVKSVIYLPTSAQDRIIYIRVEYAPFRIPRASTVYGTDFNFSLRLGPVVGIVGRVLQTTSTSGNSNFAPEPIGEGPIPE